MSNRRAAVEAWESLFRAQVSVMRHLNSGFPAQGMSFTEYDVLLNLSRQPGQRPRRTVNATATTRPRATSG